jgi:hypothetical protein
MAIKEIERLTKLYARKLNVSINTDLLEQMKKTGTTANLNSIEVEIPLFLLVGANVDVSFTLFILQRCLRPTT